MRSALSLAACLSTMLLVLASPPACFRPPERPNIVLIIGDDVGWPDFGFMGAEVVQTPHLDALAAQGVVFTHAFATASVCRPALRSLLTGLHPIQFQARMATLRMEGTRLEPGRAILRFETLPKLLAERGYASFQGGKHWEGTYQMAGFTHGMTTRYPEETSHGNALERYGGGDALELGRTTMQPLWNFIDAHLEQPFFVWFAPALPHLPHDAPQHYLRLYDGEDLSPAVRQYYANLSRFDDRIGDLLAHLEARGLRDKTLVIYISDNGWDEISPTRSALHPGLGGSKGKLSIYELGFRTPLVFSWPGVLPEGARHQHLVSAVDLFDTILDFAGARRAPGRSGASLHPLLTGTGDFGRERVIGRVDTLRNDEWNPGMAAKDMASRTEAYFLRTPTWRYVWYERDGREELYRIQKDPFETRNLVEDHPDEARRFRAEIERWTAEMTRPYLEEMAGRLGARVERWAEPRERRRASSPGDPPPAGARPPPPKR